MGLFFKYISSLTSLIFQAENDTDEVDYTEVDFSHISVTNSTLCGKSGDVVYSTPQIHASPRNHVKDASPPLYSIKPKLK